MQLALLVPKSKLYFILIQFFLFFFSGEDKKKFCLKDFKLYILPYNMKKILQQNHGI